MPDVLIREMSNYIQIYTSEQRIVSLVSPDEERSSGQKCKERSARAEGMQESPKKVERAKTSLAGLEDAESAGKPGERPNSQKGHTEHESQRLSLRIAHGAAACCALEVCEKSNPSVSMSSAPMPPQPPSQREESNLPVQF